MERLSPQELDALLVAADPSVVLVRGRILRRVIKRTRQVRGRLGQVPHRKAIVVSRDELFACVTRSELRLRDDRSLPERVILIERPTGADEELPRDAVLVGSWRLLFHARIHAALESPEVRDRLDQAAVRARIDGIGQIAFDEIRAVLDAEGLLFERRTERDEYVEFAATFLELRAFAPHLLERYFPTLEGDLERLTDLLLEDVDADGLFLKTRPAGTPDPSRALVERFKRPERARRPRGKVRRGEKVYGERWQRALLGRAERREKKGNVARAAVLRQRASSTDPGIAATRVAPEASKTIERLVRRLKAALAFDRAAEREWQSLLEATLPAASTGFRSAEGRLLYDLQKVCVDHERLVHTIDLVEWVRTLGRRPIRRALPHQREVLMCRHLRGARARCVSLKLPEGDRARLESLIADAERAAEARLRRKCRPAIERLLTEHGLQPRSVVERVARGKLTEELLDRVVARGFLSLGDVRDAISRNQLKLGDCHRLGDFWNANGLLEVDAGLGVALDGVYRRGEVYLRWLQRLSGLVFGSTIGRWLTVHVAIPFGGAYIILSGIEHTVFHVIAAVAPVHLMAIDPWYVSVLVLGAYLLALIKMEPVRAASLRGWRATLRGLRIVFFDWPRRLLALRVVRRVLGSIGWRLFIRFAVKPTALAALVALPLLWFVELSTWWSWALGCFLAAELILNSPFGAAVEEISTEWAWKTWQRFRGTFIVGLVRFFLWLFRSLIEGLERTLYVVDEWLRFKTGEGRLIFALKAILGFVWWWVSWLVRVCVNLMLEPQVNPVKHFPVVTVSHKLMLPLLDAWLRQGNELLGPVLGDYVAGVIVLGFISLFPGFFGFLVWELKENWRLYAANRAPHLQPALVGSHGESVIRLMRPGFHSGTLPKAFARLRKAERRSLWTGELVKGRKQREAIHHVEQDVATWVRRDLIALLENSPAFAGCRLEVSGVSAGSNRVRVTIGSSSDEASPLALAFEEQSGWLVASVTEPGWLEALDDQRRVVLRGALCGLYKSAGVDLIREEIEEVLGPVVPPYDISDAGLVIWPGPGYEVEELRALDPHLFGKRPLRWVDWKASWEAEQEGRERPPLLEGLRVLPG